jgi:hypothetical protein
LGALFQTKKEKIIDV